jgi:anti-sigma factor RsiW
MRCSKAHKLIGDYLDGTLQPDEENELQEHLQSCADCRELVKDFQGIVEEAKKMQMIEPSDKVWPAILSRLQMAKGAQVESRKRKAGWLESFFFQGRAKYAWGTALAAVLVIVGAVFGPRFWEGNGALKLTDQDRYTLAKLEEAEKHYMLAIQALNEAVASQKNGLDPQTAVVFDRNLKVIDSAIQACRNAVSKEPSSLDARMYLLGAYKEKVEFLDNLIDVKKKSPSQSAAEKTI